MSDDAGSRWRWRPEPWWLAVGLFAGATWGAVVGASWLFVLSLLAGGDGSIPWWGLPLGAWYGAILGAPTGVGVGTVLALVVGRDRPTRIARPLSSATAVVATPVALGVLLALITDSGLEPLPLSPLFWCAGIAAAVTCWWFAPKMERRPRMVSSA